MKGLFCPHCNSLLIRRGGELVCRNCNFFRRPSGVGGEITVTAPRQEGVVGIELQEPLGGGESILPTTRVECPKCGPSEAYVRSQQIRASDEPPTLFYRCVRCKHSWRED